MGDVNFVYIDKLSICYTAPIIGSSPRKAPAYQTSTSSSFSASNKGKHSNLILIVGIGASLLIIALVSVLVICSCALHEGKNKASPKETGMYLKQSSICICAFSLVLYVPTYIVSNL